MSSRTVFRTIREQIVEQLRQDVLSGRISAGEPLREQALAKRFGVSRGPIRDALLQLSQEGLLISRPNCGARVGPGPSASIQPLVIETRRRLERHALASILGRLGEADLQALEGRLARLKEACVKGCMADVVEHDMAFHRWIVERAQDPDLTQLWLAVITRMRLRYTRHADLMESYAEHAAVVAAIRSGDRKGALRGLEANIQ